MAKTSKRIPQELRPRELLAAYASGVFPMPDPEEPGELLWFSPDPRCLLPLDERFHVSRRLAATLRQGRFVCTLDGDFGGVMRACGRRPEGTWINRDFLAAYGQLHRLGFAHSVEAYISAAWADLHPRRRSKAHPARAKAAAPGNRQAPAAKGPLAGGLYGVAIGGAFFAESMFHRVSDAGKAALVFLVEHLRRQGFVLCDVQWLTPNLARYGACEIRRWEYLDLLSWAVGKKVKF
jgi:leucyl/phenylalanyl-tRNA--protein transferase